jgi:hypothetical protein
MFQTDSVESTIREALARVDTYSLEEFTEQLPPTKPGIYWFHSETETRAMLVEVRVTKGELTALWPTIDQSVTKLKGNWRGPVPPHLDTSTAGSPMGHITLNRG